jgi:Domain of unknown function (DUF1841)
MEFDKESQVRILQVAAGREEGKDFEELDARIAHVMDMHPEFDEIWKLGELATHPQEIGGQIVNPFVHTVLHVIVDKQILTGQLEYVEVTYSRLKGQGMDDHHALHVIIAVYADLHFGSFRQGKPFDTLDYESQLVALSFEKADSED